MKDGSPAKVGYRGVFVAFVIAVSSIVSPAFCKSQNYTLLVQQTPTEGGSVTPLSGAHQYEENEAITLTATPNEGYEFLYWLGDVSDQQSTSTTVQLNKPKIVVAVFEPIRDDLKITNFSGSGGGSPGQVSNPVNIGSPAIISGTGSKQVKQVSYALAGDDQPAIPEPATAILLALGSLFTFGKRTKRRTN